MENETTKKLHIEPAFDYQSDSEIERNKRAYEETIKKLDLDFNALFKLVETRIKNVYQQSMVQQLHRPGHEVRKDIIHVRQFREVLRSLAEHQYQIGQVLAWSIGERYQDRRLQGNPYSVPELYIRRLKALAKVPALEIEYSTQ